MKLQEITIKSIHGFRRVVYTKRLCRLKLFPLWRRRLRGDLNEIFKIIREAVYVNPGNSFAFHGTLNLRRHQFTLAKPRVYTSLQKQSIELRVIIRWNHRFSTYNIICTVPMEIGLRRLEHIPRQNRGPTWSQRSLDYPIPSQLATPCCTTKHSLSHIP